MKSAIENACHELENFLKSSLIVWVLQMSTGNTFIDKRRGAILTDTQIPLE